MSRAERERWAAVYRSSAYGFAADGGAWRWFALDGADPALTGCARSVTLITAWNPESVERPRADNDAAQQRLEAELRAAGVRFVPAAGSSLPGTAPAWREEGCALLGVARADALMWGRRCRQRALVRLEAGAAALLFCADGYELRCGVRVLAAPVRE